MTHEFDTDCPTCLRDSNNKVLYRVMKRLHETNGGPIHYWDVGFAHAIAKAKGRGLVQGTYRKRKGYYYITQKGIDLMDHCGWDTSQIKARIAKKEQSK